MKTYTFLTILLLTSLLWGLRYEDLPKRPFRIVPADMDNDGDLDLVIGHVRANSSSEYTGVISIHTNNGQGQFELQDSLNCYSSQKYLDVGRFDTSSNPVIATSWNTEDHGSYGIALLCHDHLIPSSWSVIDSLIIDTVAYLKIDLCYSDSVVQAIGFASQSGGHFGVISVVNGNLTNLYDIFLDGSLQGVKCADLDGDGVDELIALGSPIRIFSLADLENPVILDTVMGDHCLVFDLDDDDDMDIVLCALTIWGIVTYYIEQTDSMTFQLAYQESPDDAFLAEYIGDFNQDDELELVGYANIFQQTSDFDFDWMSTFLPPSLYHANNYADLDGNGYNDLMFVGMGEDRGWLEILYDYGGFDFRDDPDVTSIDDPPNPVDELAIAVFPNPGKGDISVSFSAPSDAAYTLSVFNIRGQRVIHLGGRANHGDKRLSLNTENLATGVYLIDLHVGPVASRKRISIVK